MGLIRDGLFDTTNVLIICHVQTSSHKPEGTHVSQFLLFAFCPCIKRERKHIIRCKVETSSREEFELRSPCGIKQLNKSLI